MTVKELWACVYVWENACGKSAYTQRAALRCKARALIAEDRNHG